MFRIVRTCAAPRCLCSLSHERARKLRVHTVHTLPLDALHPYRGWLYWPHALQGCRLPQKATMPSLSVLALDLLCLLRHQLALDPASTASHDPIAESNTSSSSQLMLHHSKRSAQLSPPDPCTDLADVPPPPFDHAVPIPSFSFFLLLTSSPGPWIPSTFMP